MVKRKKSRSKKNSNSFKFEDLKDYISENIKKSKNKIKNIKNKIKDYITTNYSDEIDAVKKFLIKIFGYGLIINYSLHFLLGTNFNLFTLFAWGIVYYFIEDEFVTLFRRLIAKR